MFVIFPTGIVPECGSNNKDDEKHVDNIVQTAKQISNQSCLYEHVWMLQNFLWKSTRTKITSTSGAFPHSILPQGPPAANKAVVNTPPSDPQMFNRNPLFRQAWPWRSVQPFCRLRAWRSDGFCSFFWQYCSKPIFVLTYVFNFLWTYVCLFWFHVDWNHYFETIKTEVFKVWCGVFELPNLGFFLVSWGLLTLHFVMAGQPGAR